MKNVFFSVLSVCALLTGSCRQTLLESSDKTKKEELVTTANADPSFMSLKQIDPLLKVFKTGTLDPNWGTDTTFTYRGGYVNLHFVLSAGEALSNVQASIIDPTGILTPSQVGWVRQVGASHAVPGLVGGLYSADRTFPDAIINDAPATVAAGNLQSFWATIPISTTLGAGVYKATFKVTAIKSGTPYSVEREFVVRVFPVTMTSSRLFVSNWFYHTPENYAFLNNGIPVTMYSTKFWELTAMVANMMSEYKQNVIHLSPLVLTQITKTGSTYSFDFSRFDQMVNLFKQTGTLKRIEGEAIASRLTGAMDSPYGIWVPNATRTTGYENTLFPATDAGAQSFLSQFMTALTLHLKQKNWFNDYYQHVADEPVPGNASSYISIGTMVKNAVPDMKILEAVMTPNLGNLVDVYVPKMDHLHGNYSTYQSKQANGSEVWFYTCNEPTGSYANRFVEQQLSYMRILHWINFKFGITGYLHWSLFNYPIIGAADVFTETSGTWLPGGDAFIVYPGYNKFYKSIRYEQMREGIMDYELLSRLKEKDAAKADLLAGQIAWSFSSYQTNVSIFQQVRKEALTALAY
ncbi:DUF4091 domain-containing protein [Chitinophaga defluvii]|uniref:DUF4091 domain-containing protein n=1 Tax=Chitinophaga defluvii TaxID=3163343 RepID=A0ABV2SZ85_9BACT